MLYFQRPEDIEDDSDVEYVEYEDEYEKCKLRHVPVIISSYVVHSCTFSVLYTVCPCMTVFLIFIRFATAANLRVVFTFSYLSYMLQIPENTTNRIMIQVRGMFLFVSSAVVTPA